MKGEYSIFERFLKFAYADLSTMTEEDKLWLATTTYLDGTGLSRLVEEGLIEVMSKSENVNKVLDDLEKTQLYVQKLVNLMFSVVWGELLEEKVEDLRVERDKALGHNVKGKAKQYLPIKIWEIEAKVELLCEIEGTGLLANTIEDHVGFNVSSGDRRLITTINIKKTFWKNIEYNLHLAVNGMPIKALRRCPECEHIYIHTSKKRRIYCTNKCAARANLRRTRREAKANSSQE